MNGGNDFPIAQIPGVLVFAVNPVKETVPWSRQVFVPNAILSEVQAATDVLARFNRCALTLISEYINETPSGGDPKDTPTALDQLKEELFKERIRKKVEMLLHSRNASVEQLQTIHALVTLMSRTDPAARQWITILMDELDAIMAELKTTSHAVLPALGNSHPDRI